MHAVELCISALFWVCIFAQVKRRHGLVGLARDITGFCFAWCFWSMSNVSMC